MPLFSGSRRRFLLRFSLVLTVLVGAYSALLWADTAPLLTRGEAARTEGAPGLTCASLDLTVQLSKPGGRDYQLNGDLCHQGPLKDQLVQVLVSGAGYGPSYWDSPHEPDTYSYVRAATRRGFATFNFSRLGLGASERPFGFSLNVDTHAEVLHQVITQLNARMKRRGTQGQVVTVGHSMGSLIVLSHALRHADEVRGIVLTGYLHARNPEFRHAIRASTGFALADSKFGGDIFDFSYLVSHDNTRKDLFYSATTADPAAVKMDEKTKETLTIGEVITVGSYRGDESKALQVPAMVVSGDEDLVNCGAALDCKDHAAMVENEQGYYPTPNCVNTLMVADTGHNLNLHRTAPKTYQHILEWISERLGPDVRASAPKKCT